MFFDNFLNFTAKVKKFSQNQYEKFNWFKEYRGIFIAVAILKVFTSVVSIVAGYNFMYNTFYQLYPSETSSRIFSFVSLILIELLTSYFISKSCKMFWHRDFKTCAKLAAGAVVMFALSSYVSVKGMVFFTSERVDNTEIIVNENKILLDNLNSEHNDIITQYKASITEIKNNPEGWVNGKRSVLTSAQQENIQRLNNYIKEENDRYYKERAELKQDKAESLTKNDNETEEKATNYGKYVAIIMLMQLITSVGLSYCCMKTATDGQEDFEIKEFVKDTQDYAVNTMMQSLIKRLTEFGGMIASALAIQETKGLTVADKNKHLIFARAEQPNENTEQAAADPGMIAAKATTEPGKTVSQKPIPTPQQPIGFNIPDTEQTETKPTEPNTDIAESAMERKQTTDIRNPYGIGICPYCGKEFVRKTYNMKFCCTEHKNSYWAMQHPNDVLDEAKFKHNKKTHK